MPVALPTSALARLHTPQQAELLRRRSELAALRASLADRERSLDALRGQLHSFEGRYIRQVGVLYRQLDDWEQRIAELKISRETPEERARFAQVDTPLPELDAPAAGPAADLKALFRELAKRIHPDFARSNADAHHRTRLMAQANEAYLRNDAAVLQRMLDGHDSTGTLAPTTAAQLSLTLTLLASVQADIASVDAEFLALAQSEMALLRDRTLLAAASGNDHLAEMAARVKGSIGIAMRRYDLDLGRARRHQPNFDPTPFLSAEAP